MPSRAVFLDRDGVLNDIVERDGRPGSPRSLEQFRLARDVDVVQRLKDAGLRVFIITNQPDVSRGNVRLEDVDAMIAAIRERVGVDDYMVCTHDDQHGCDCRKPKPGMLLELGRRWNVDLSRSWVVGDMWRDVEAARAAGCSSILIRRDYNADTAGDRTVDSLSAAVDAVLSDADGSDGRGR